LVAFCDFHHHPPPSTPLFPYTTLFRSHHSLSESCKVATVAATAGKNECALVAHDRGACLHEGIIGCEDAAVADDQGAGIGEGAGDRKSTRLNSSHVSTSYAVFCLKKKT